MHYQTMYPLENNSVIRIPCIYPAYKSSQFHKAPFLEGDLENSLKLQESYGHTLSLRNCPLRNV